MMPGVTGHNGSVWRVGQCAKVGEIYVSWGSFRPLAIPEEAREYDICFVNRRRRKGNTAIDVIIWNPKLERENSNNE